MAGKKGQKAWNKRDEYEWRDIWALSKTELVGLASYFKRQIKKYGEFETAYKTDENFRKLYHKWLEISSTVFVKGIPQKIEGNIKHTGEFEHFFTNTDAELDQVEEEILRGSPKRFETSAN